MKSKKISKCPVIVSVKECYDEEQLVFRIPEEDLPVAEKGTVKQILQYAVGESVDIDGKQYVRKLSGRDSRMARLKTIVSHDLIVMVNGKYISPRDHIRDFFDEMAFRRMQRTKYEIVDQTDGRSDPLSSEVARKIREKHGNDLEGCFIREYQDTDVIHKSASDVLPSVAKLYNPYLMCNLVISNPEFGA